MVKARIFFLSCLCFITLQAVLGIEAYANSAKKAFNEKKIIVKTEILSQINYLQQELNLIEAALGKHYENKPVIVILNATPKELYFQAESVLNKIDRLTYEITSTITQHNLKDIAENRIIGVNEFVELSIKQVKEIKKKLHIEDEIKLEHYTQADNAQLFNGLLSISQQLNHLLYKKMAPADVYKEVTLSVNYMAELLQYVNSDELLPEKKDFIANKTPTEVYQNLIKCLELIKEISTTADIPILAFNIKKLDQHSIEPGQVFDLARIIVSELDNMYSMVTQKSFDIESYYPGHKTPSEVFQRTELLIRQLTILKQETKINPSLLKKNNS